MNEIEVSTRDGQTLRGTPVEIVRAMQANAATWLRIKTLPDYIAAEVAIAQRAEDLELSVAGDTDEALARSYVTELLRVGGMRETQRR